MFDMLGAIINACFESIRLVFNDFGTLGLMSAVFFVFVVGAILVLRKK